MHEITRGGQILYPLALLFFSVSSKMIFEVVISLTENTRRNKRLL